ncbi:MAG TPA: CHAT domain-containing tetratricopeptide repeat protein [Stellaceae bacterium]|nr:CHAT domain-containing tetratricopeptide repeat protein [Stellaceae bacterium]
MTIRSPRLASALFGAAFVALALGTSPLHAATSGGPLGNTAAGEECRWAPRPGMPPVPGMPAPLDVFCGAGKTPTGAVWIDGLDAGVPSEGAARKAALEATAKRTLEGSSIARRMRCDAGQAMGGDQSVQLYTCTLRDGGWPQSVLMVGAGNRLYQAEGLPGMLSVLAKAIEQAAGRPVLSADAASALASAAAALGSKGGGVASGDFQKFNELMRLGRLYNSTRNYPASEDSFRKALEIQTRVFGADGPGSGEVLLELALAVSHQGRYDEAGSLFRRAEPIVQRLEGVVRGRLFAYLAIDASLQGRYQDALGYARESMALRRREVDPSADTLADLTGADPKIGAKGELVHSLMVEGDALLKTGDIAGAEADLNEALQYLVQVRGLPQWWRAQALSQLAEIEAAQGRYAFAERNMAASVKVWERVFAKTAPTSEAYLEQARFYSEGEDYPNAIEAFHSATDILSHDDVARTLVTPDDIAYFLVAASAAAARDAARRAELENTMFEAIQYTGSSVADQAVAHAAVRLAAGDPAIADLVRDLQEAERARDTARLQLSGEQVKPLEERGKLIEDALAKQADEAAAKAAALQARLVQAFPAYAKFAQPEPVKLVAMQKMLGPEEAFVTFVVGQEKAFVVAVRRDRLAVRAIDITDAQLTQAVADLRKAFVPRLGALPEFDLKGSNALYKKLLGPVETDLADVKHVIAAPEGALASLPLGLLVTAPSAQGSYASAAWLIRRMAVSEVPSPRAFIELRQARAEAKPAPRPFLGVGNPSFTGGANAPGKASALDQLASTCREGGPMPAELIRALTPLPETADEVRRVGQRLGADPGSILTGAAASEANLRRQALGDYNVLYFATHGLLPGELRCQGEPGLALSPPAGGTQSAADDGLLEASEIAGLRLNADLVVLSACNTAEGGGRLGGGSLSGLADAFFHAGARTLVASHWQVPSAATAQLMTGFFDRVGPKLSNGLADSLREAQLGLAGQAQTAHPFYWAAFTILGDGGRRGVNAASTTMSE